MPENHTEKCFNTDHPGPVMVPGLLHWDWDGFGGWNGCLKLHWDWDWDCFGDWNGCLKLHWNWDWDGFGNWNSHHRRVPNCCCQVVTPWVAGEKLFLQTWHLCNPVCSVRDGGRDLLRFSGTLGFSRTCKGLDPVTGGAGGGNGKWAGWDPGFPGWAAPVCNPILKLAW